MTSKQFQTSVARRKGEPVTIEIEHWASPETEGSGSGEAVTRSMRVDPHVDLVTIGAAFSGFGQLMQSFNEDDASAEEKMRKLQVELPRARGTFRDLLIPTDRGKWDDVADGVDFQMLGELVRYVTNELSGLDPTQPKSSSTSLSETGAGSTDGVPPAV